ncbi:MAG: hypothetical protein NTU41_09090, partial [Chloroflexi bacterium]|nr:hypothetical protein [Chloroflexota bacterium]
EENDHVAIIAQLPAPLHLAREGQVFTKDGIMRITVGKAVAESQTGHRNGVFEAEGEKEV